jgi:lipopolysaccharide/colanic/teichoic acid biosynthesis glycosyltransferase
LFPLLFCVAIAVKLSSPGPIFFAQDRIGLNKRRFKIWKFRTMVADAEKLRVELEKQNEMGGPAFKIKNDRGLRLSESGCGEPASTSCRSFSMS